MSYTTKYKFTKFDDMKFDGEYNFFGIIFDAAFPIFSETPYPHYECTLKLIDDSIDFSNDFLDEDYITLIIKSQNKEEIIKDSLNSKVKSCLEHIIGSYILFL